MRVCFFLLGTLFFSISCKQETSTQSRFYKVKGIDSLFVVKQKVLIDAKIPLSNVVKYEVFNDSLFVSSANAPINVFSAKSGSYLYSIGGLGKGPGEFFILTDIMVTKSLVVGFDPSQYKLLFFHKSGKHLSTVAIPPNLIGTPVHNVFYDEEMSTFFFVNGGIVEGSPFRIMMYKIDLENFKLTQVGNLIKVDEYLNPYMPLIGRGILDGGSMYLKDSARILTVLPFSGNIFIADLKNKKIEVLQNKTPPFFKAMKRFDEKEFEFLKNRKIEDLRIEKRKATAIKQIALYKDKFLIKIYANYPEPEKSIVQSFIVIDNLSVNKSYYIEDTFDTMGSTPDLIKDSLMYKLDFKPVYEAALVGKVANPILKVIDISKAIQ